MFDAIVNRHSHLPHFTALVCYPSIAVQKSKLTCA